MNKTIQYLIGGASVIILIAGLKTGADLINPILMALLLAVCVAPLPEWLGKKGFSTNMALGLTLILVVAFGILISILLANSLAGLTESLPVYEQKLTEYGNDLIKFAQSKNLDVSKLVSSANINSEKLVGFVESIAGSMTGIISSTVVILILILFFVVELVGYESDTRKGKRNKLSLHDWLVTLSGDLRKYITINSLEGLILGVMNFIFMLIMGVDFAFLWAFISFFLNFIPNIGFFLSIVGPGLVSLVILGPNQAIIVIIGFFLINLFVENVLGPLFMKQGLNVSLLNSFLSMMVWGWILGWSGAFLGIPLTMVLMEVHSNIKNKKGN